MVANVMIGRWREILVVSGSQALGGGRRGCLVRFVESLLVGARV